MTNVTLNDAHYTKYYKNLFQSERHVPVLEIPQGWHLLFSQLCEELNVLEDAEQIVFLQVKEKNSELRVYLDDYNDIIDMILEKYTSLSKRTCMRCADDEVKVTSSRFVLCDSCK